MLLGLRAGIDRALRWLTFGLIAALLVCVMLGVITRALRDPFIWTDEVSRFLMVWLACFGWMLASRRRAHIRISFFQYLLPKRMGRFSEILIQCAVLVLGALLFWFGIDLVVRNHDLDALTIPISMSWLYAPIVIAGLMTVVQAANEITETSRASRPLSGPDEGLVE
jgi:TRAP-type C4-dicarboxylate transport system permease small subunit